MIEVTYKEGGQASEQVQAPVKIPKNIRQIGEVHSKKKIYVEDYVITYLRQLSKKAENIPQAAVLLGETKQMDGVQYIFASGAVETEKVEVDYEGIQFTDEAWTDVYEKIKNHFDELDIVGWMMIVPGLSLEVNGDIVKTHIRNFSDGEKIFMMMEPAEREESFYLYENGDLVRQKGYYIYFEKNAAMQDYMIQKHENVSIEVTEKIQDRAAANFRRMVQDREEDKHQQRMMRFMYLASSFLVMVVMVIGITMINNYDKMRNMEESLQTLSSSVGDNDKESGKSGQEVPVENVPADVEVIKEDDENNQAEKKEVDKTDDDAGEPVNNDIPDSYIVQKGDTLASISKKMYGSIAKVDEICELNDIENGNKIVVGQKIILPR